MMALYRWIFTVVLTIFDDQISNIHWKTKTILLILYLTFASTMLLLVTTLLREVKWLTLFMCCWLTVIGTVTWEWIPICIDFIFAVLILRPIFWQLPLDWLLSPEVYCLFLQAGEYHQQSINHLPCLFFPPSAQAWSSHCVPHDTINLK